MKIESTGSNSLREDDWHLEWDAGRGEVVVRHWWNHMNGRQEIESEGNETMTLAEARTRHPQQYARATRLLAELLK